MFLRKMVATVHLVIGAYVLLGVLLAIYLSFNIFFIDLRGVHPFVMVVAALLAVSDIAGGLLEFVPKTKG